MKIDIRDKLVWDSLIMVASLAAASVFNVLFQAVVGRNLSREEFGILAALLAAANMTHMPLAAVSSGITHYVALEIQQRRADTVRRLFLRWTGRMAVLAVPLLVAGVAGAGPIARFFNLDRSAPVVVMTAVIVAELGAAVVNGILHGLQQFTWLLFVNLTLSVFRVAGAALFIFLVVPAAGWALLGHGVGLVAAVLVGVAGIHLNSEPAGASPPPVAVRLRGYVAKSVCLLGAYAVMMQADVIVVRHYLPDASGGFAYASTLGKIMILICIPVAKSLFPKVVSSGAATAEHIRMMRKALEVTGALAVLIAVGCTLLPGIPLRLLYRIPAPDLHARMLVAAMAWTMIPVGLINLVVNFQLAQRRFGELWPIPVGAAAYVASFLLWHESVWQIVAALFATASLTLGGLLWFLPRVPDAGGLPRPVADPEAAPR